MLFRLIMVENQYATINVSLTEVRLYMTLTGGTEQAARIQHSLSLQIKNLRSRSGGRFSIKLFLR